MQTLTLLDGKAIGENIYLSRKASGMKAMEVAEKLGISESAYTRYERGERSPKIELINKIAAIINVNPLQLLSIPAQQLINNKSDNSPGSMPYLYSDRWPKDQSKEVLAVMERVAISYEKILEKLK